MKYFISGRARMVGLAFLILILSACQTSPHEATDISYDFPEDWIGDWEGTLSIWRPGVDTAQKVAMELHVHPIGNDRHWTWTIVYGSGENRAPREYELIEKDRDRGMYTVDEKNGIFLDGIFMEDTYFGQFSVMGSLITDAYKRVPEGIEFSIIASSLDQAVVSGDTILPGGDTIPEVLDYPITSRHKAILRKTP